MRIVEAFADVAAGGGDEPGLGIWNPCQAALGAALLAHPPGIDPCTANSAVSRRFAARHHHPTKSVNPDLRLMPRQPITACVGMGVLIALRRGHLQASPSSSLV